MESYLPGEGSERVPLLLSRRSKEKNEDSPQDRDGRGVVDTEPDAIDQLEKLPVLLVHAVIVFTFALCVATAIRLVRFAVAICKSDSRRSYPCSSIFARNRKGGNVAMNDLLARQTEETEAKVVSIKSRQKRNACICKGTISSVTSS